MSVRTIRRNRERALEQERRREARRLKRAGLAASAAIGASVVLASPASAANFTVDTLADPGNGDGCGTTDCSLREAVDEADSNNEADTISFANGLTGTITLTGGPLQVGSPEGIDIQGPGVDQVSISGDDSTRVFFVYPYGKLSVSDLTITGGLADTPSGPAGPSGGGIAMGPYANVQLTDAAVTDSYSSGYGGGIANLGGQLTVTHTEISGNGSQYFGGGIFSSGSKYAGSPPGGGAGGAQADAAQEPASTVVTDSAVLGNQTQFGGGGIWSSGAKYFSSDTPPNSAYGTLEVSGTTITGNSAEAGAGAFTKYSDSEITDSQVSENVGSGFVGLALFGESDVSVDHTKITGNEGDQQGGGGLGAGKYIHLTLADSNVSGNSAEYAGGIAFNNEIGGKYSGSNTDAVSDITMTRTTVANNVSDYDGGGMDIIGAAPGSSVVVANSTISGNRASTQEGSSGGNYGGGGIAIYSDIGGKVAIRNSTVSGNSADVGGGISVDTTYDPPQNFRAADLFGRDSDPGADGVYGAGSLTVENTTVASNAAAIRGGGVYLGYYTPPSEPPQSITLPLSSTIVADNTAGGAANDLAQTAHTEQPNGFQLTNSLIESPGSASLTQSPAGSSIVGSDPQLGQLADNGGPTRTQLPGGSSPAIDTGRANGLTTDQRGLPRTVDLGYPNGAGDGTDIGSVELQSGTPPDTHTRTLNRDEVPKSCTVDYDSAQLKLIGDGTSQTLTGTDGSDILLGSGGDDEVLGLKADDCLYGGAGSDLVKGAGGDDHADGGADDDKVTGSGGEDTVKGRRGDDKLKLGGGDDRGLAGLGDDSVNGGGGDDFIRGRSGDDKLTGSGGDDAIRGGDDDDKLNGGKGDNVLRGGAGDDLIIANGGVDDIRCGTGRDVVRGADKNDVIGDDCEIVK